MRLSRRTQNAKESSSRPTRSYTVVSFHAHPDDEALLTAGTLARAAADGHRVVIVVATDGEAGLTRNGLNSDQLGLRRRAELQESATAIGAQEVYFLGYRDSGFDPTLGAPAAVSGNPASFADLEPRLAAGRLAKILRDEQADVVTIYDPAGGYGHPDHLQVHRVGVLAAEVAETPVVLEATIDRELLARAATFLRRVSRFVPAPAMPDLTEAFTPRSQLTHRVDVRAHLPAKVRALRAHSSQAEGGDNVRTLALLLRLPRPLRRKVLGTEWFRELGRAPDGILLDDIFGSLRQVSPGSVQADCRSRGRC